MGISSTIIDYLDELARRTPVANAVLEKNRKSLSFEDLLAQIQYVQSIFYGLKFDSSDRVAIALPNDGNMVTSLLGVMSCAVAVPLNPNLTEAEFDKYLALVKAKAVIVEADVVTPARISAQRLGLRVLEARCGSDVPTGVFRFAEVERIPLRPLSKPNALDIGLMQLTTGSTSQPKTVPLSHRTLTHRALKHARWVLLDDADRGLLFMPLFHGQGLNMGIIPSLIVGGSIVVVPDFNIDAFFGLLREFQPTWYTASPAHHRAILGKAEEYNAALNQCHLRFIRSGSQNLSSQLSARLADAFGAPVIETYNTSETGQLAGGLLSEAAASEDDGLALSDDVAIMDESGGMLPTEEVGEVVARGESVFDGYADSDESTDVVFTNGWFRTGDLGCITPNGRLILMGRKKELINRGGEKIAPLEVDQALEAHPDVESAISFGIPHPSLGEHVGAAVITREGSIATEAELRRFVQSRLASFKVPRRIAFVREFPIGPSAKVDRKAIAALALADWARPLNRSRANDRPAKPLEAALQKFWAEALGLDRVGLDEDFFMLGGDSLQAVDLFLHIEQELGRLLPRSVLFEAGTVAKMAQRIEEFVPSPCLVPIQPKGDGPPFFCVHGGGGQVLNFRDLARLLGEAQPFYAIQSRGLDGEEEPFTRIEDMAAHYVGEIKKAQPVGPYFLGGFSFGGRVACVMAQQLRAMGEEVALLALIDAYSRSGQRTVGWQDWFAHYRERLRVQAVPRVPAFLWRRVSNLAKRIYMGLRVRIFSMAWQYFESQGRPIPRIMRRPILANDIISRDYRARPFDGDAILFKAERYALLHADQHDRWHDLIKGKLVVIQVPGTHHEIMNQPHVRALAKELAAALIQAQAGSEGPG